MKAQSSSIKPRRKVITSNHPHKEEDDGDIKTYQNYPHHQGKASDKLPVKTCSTGGRATRDEAGGWNEVGEEPTEMKLAAGTKLEKSQQR